MSDEPVKDPSLAEGSQRENTSPAKKKKDPADHTPNAEKAEVFQKVAGRQVPGRKGQKSPQNRELERKQKERDRRNTRGKTDAPRRGRSDGPREARDRGLPNAARGFEAGAGANQKPVPGSMQNRPLAEGNFEAPTRVGGERNDHGTRVARRVICNRCQAVDHVSYLDKDKDFALCRTCAEEMMNVFEVGRKKRMATREVDCNLCGVPFGLPVTAEDDGDPLCDNCLKEWMGWQGSLDMTYDERNENALEKTRPGIALRRKNGVVNAKKNDVTDENQEDG
ncbi:MAG: hypothetical protein GY822_20515 [Deltaproteobacteria bacterium]|nr:hypothetical protein [Deltaproteobacteria bacterium]